jgi:hypothetical protein
MPRKTRNTARTNKKRTKLVKALAKGMNIAEASREAGYASPQAGHFALTKIREYLPDILKTIDLPIEKVMIKFKDKLEARETRYFQHNGIVLDEREVEAHDTQLHAADSLSRIFGLFPRNGHEDGGSDTPSGPTFNMVFNTPGEAEGIIRAMADLTSGNGQPVLDAARDEDEGRPGPDKAV